MERIFQDALFPINRKHGFHPAQESGKKPCAGLKNHSALEGESARQGRSPQSSRWGADAASREWRSAVRRRRRSGNALLSPMHSRINTKTDGPPLLRRRHGMKAPGSAGVPPAQVLAQPRPSPPPRSTGNGAGTLLRPSPWRSRRQGGRAPHRRETERHATG